MKETHDEGQNVHSNGGKKSCLLMHTFGVFVRLHSEGGKASPRKADMEKGDILHILINPYWLTDDVYDPCSHGVNTAAELCSQCEEDASWVRIVDGVVHYSDAKL